MSNATRAVAGTAALLISLAFAQTKGNEPGSSVRIRGRAIDTCGEPIASGTVRLMIAGLSETQAVTQTDVDGRFVLPAISSQPYDLHFEGSGVEPLVETVTVSGTHDLDLPVVVNRIGLILCTSTPPVGYQSAAISSSLTPPSDSAQEASLSTFRTSDEPIITTLCEIVREPQRFNRRLVQFRAEYVTKFHWLLVLNHPLTLLGLDEVGLGGLLASETVRLAVEGSRHFRSPTHLGLMLYEGCEIAVFTRDLNNQRDSFMKTVRDSGTHIVQIEGATVAEFKVGIEDDTWTVMVAFPMPRVVLVATDETYLREVLRRMRGARGTRALPASLPEWKYVRTNSSVWGLRHFDKTEQIDDDPSTPLSKQRAANIPDHDAIGVAFYIEPPSRKLAHVAYLSGSRAREILSAVLGPVSSSPQDISVPSQAFTVAPGVIECTVPMETPHTAIDLLFLLSGLFGHAIYL
jgi:hypothetical protein